MEKIASFTVNHMILLPGIYVSRVDRIPAQDGSKTPVTTYDIRLTRPNFEPVMNTGEAHTLEHLGATYLRNREDIKDRVIYWGPMGCRTGFYLILRGDTETADLVPLMKDLFSFMADFEGEIPGARPEDCGNYSDMDLPAAKKRAASFVTVLSNITPDRLKYQG